MRTIATEQHLREQGLREANDFLGRLLKEVVDTDRPERFDHWVKQAGSELLRKLAGLALMLRAEQSAKAGPCDCGAQAEFKQRRPFTLHTVVPGRDVELVLPYALCPQCRAGQMPLLRELRCDAEGFTQALRDMALLAAVKEPYEEAAESTLPIFAGVDVSRKKLHALVQEHGPVASQLMKETPQASSAEAPTYVGIDGGMAFVDKTWQEVKMGVVFSENDFARNDDSDRGVITARSVVGVRGSPSDLAPLLEPLAAAHAGRELVVIADGARWIWNLADQLFPNRTEILDWYHVDEHVSEAARLIHGEGTEEAARWRALQLERLAHDEVDHVLEELLFLSKGHRRRAIKEAASNLHDYLKSNRHRVLYATFKARGLRIGSGFVESAVNHVMQQRMKRPGMRWRAPGADAMIPLRCVLRTTGGWDRLLARAKSTGTG